jgi:hypothetical protein
MALIPETGETSTRCSGSTLACCVAPVTITHGLTVRESEIELPYRGPSRNVPGGNLGGLDAIKRDRSLRPASGSCPITARARRNHV